MKKCLLCACIIGIFTAGCVNVKGDVQTTKSWEGHYYSVEEFKKATENITLNEKESIWVLSDQSLSRALKNMMK